MKEKQTAKQTAKILSKEEQELLLLVEKGCWLLGGTGVRDYSDKEYAMDQVINCQDVKAALDYWRAFVHRECLDKTPKEPQGGANAAKVRGSYQELFKPYYDEIDAGKRDASGYVIKEG